MTDISFHEFLRSMFCQSYLELFESNGAANLSDWLEFSFDEVEETLRDLGVEYFFKRARYFRKLQTLKNPQQAPLSSYCIPNVPTMSSLLESVG